MDTRHFHNSVEHVLVTTVGVVLTIHVIRFVAGKLVTRPGAVGTVGKAIGGVFSFPAGIN